MKLELGKKYLTREGGVARVICVDYSVGDFSLMAIALISTRDGSGEIVQKYYLDGGVMGPNINYTLIEEYHDPIELKFWATAKPGDGLEDLVFSRRKPPLATEEKLFRVTAVEVKDE